MGKAALPQRPDGRRQFKSMKAGERVDDN